MEEVKKTVKTREKLIGLWEGGFLRDWHSANEIATELSKEGFNFGASTLSKALSRAAFITSKGKGRSLKYIQKYPFEK